MTIWSGRGEQARGVPGGAVGQQQAQQNADDHAERGRRPAQGGDDGVGHERALAVDDPGQAGREHGQQEAVDAQGDRTSLDKTKELNRICRTQLFSMISCMKR